MQSVFNEISLLCYFLVFWILEKRLNEKLFGRNWFHWYTADLDLCYHLFFQNAFFLLWKKIQTNIPIIASALQSRSSIFPVILKRSQRKGISWTYNWICSDIETNAKHFWIQISSSALLLFDKVLNFVKQVHAVHFWIYVISSQVSPWRFYCLSILQLNFSVPL